MMYERFERTNEHRHPMNGEWFESSIGPMKMEPKTTCGEHWILRPLPDAPAAEPDPAPLPSAEEFVDELVTISIGAIRRRDAQHAAARPVIDQHGLLCEISYAVTMDDDELAKVRGLIAQYCGAARKAVDVEAILQDIYDLGGEDIGFEEFKRRVEPILQKHLGAGSGEGE